MKKRIIRITLRRSTKSCILISRKALENFRYNVGCDDDFDQWAATYFDKIKWFLNYPDTISWLCDLNGVNKGYSENADKKNLIARILHDFLLYKY